LDLSHGVNNCSYLLNTAFIYCQTVTPNHLQEKSALDSGVQIAIPRAPPQASLFGQFREDSRRTRDATCAQRRFDGSGCDGTGPLFVLYPEV